MTRFTNNWSVTWGDGWQLRIWRSPRRPMIDLIKWPRGKRTHAEIYIGRV